jgi:hypothetical protein
MTNRNETVESLRAGAERAGLTLTDEELERLRRGVERATGWGEVVRRIAGMESEPAGVFDAARAETEAQHG